MGLDSVELLVSVEKTFDIEIPSRKAEKINTVGDFYDAVWNEIKEKESNKCKSAMLYYKLRHFFQDRYSLSRQDFTPDSSLDNIIPKDQRRTEWKSIQKDFEFKLPELIFPTWLSQSLFYFGAITTIGGLITAFFAINHWGASYSWWFIPIFGLALPLALHRVLGPFKTIVPQESVREFIESVLTLNYKKLSELFGTNRQEMERVMTVIIHDRTGVEYSKIRPEASIVNDLGID